MFHGADGQLHELTSDTPEPVRMLDHIFPIFDVTETPSSAELVGYLGTAFLIGRRGFAMTAAHVFTNMRGNVARAGFPDEVGLRGHAVTAVESHATEDIAILSLASPPLPSRGSIVRITEVEATASFPYQLWGYPEDAAYELVDGNLKNQLRPDLVYSAGHIRRRMTNVPLPSIRGAHLIELSTVAGAGCSGSPVLDRRPGWGRGLLGIYLGERTNDRATSVGYATRIEHVHNWAPDLLGRPLAQELADTD
jgi:hypothetical protein